MDEKAQNKLEKTLRSLEKSSLTFLKDLIAIPTINPPGENYQTCANFLADRLKELGLKTRVLQVPWKVQKRSQPHFQDYPRWNVIARHDVGAKKTLHFNAHYDVVPVSGRWRFGPFEPKIYQGWIYGRGSADMKGSIASCLLAVQALLTSGLSPSVNIEISFTADEETGGQLGAGYIVQEGLIDADYAIVMEGGGKDLLGLGHNGVLWLQGTCHGKAAHGAMPENGVNAFQHMNQVTSDLFQLAETFPKRKFRRKGLPTSHPTLNIGGVFQCGPGSKVNTVPAEAMFTLDRRLTPNESLAKARKEIEKHSKRAKRKFPKLQLEFETLFACEPCLISESETLARRGKATLEDLLGRPINFDVCKGFTDLHYFVVDGGIPGVGYGPDGENYHGVDERVELSEILSTARFYAQLLLNLERKS